MSREDVVAVAVRLLALYLFLTGLGSAVRAVALFSSSEWAGPSHDGAGVMLFVLPVMFVIVSVLLWFFPLTVASRLLPVMREPPPPLRAPIREIETVAFTVAGLWLLADALADAGYWIALIIAMNRSELEEMAWSAEQVASVWTTAIELALALVLLLGTHGLQRALHRLRGRSAEG